MPTQSDRIKTHDYKIAAIRLLCPSVPCTALHMLYLVATQITSTDICPH